jgi:hypothetical protein
MFIGHFALGYAAKRWVPQLSLGVLFAAPLFADLLWPVLVAAGIEQVRIVPGITAATPLEFISYPYSHSLAALAVWGVLFGWICARRRRPAAVSPAGSARRVFGVTCVLVISHWVLDYITHIPDMPLYPGGPKYGLGLWNSVAGTFAVETAMFAAGVWMYARATKARDRIGTGAFAGLTAFLFAGFIANAGTPPPSDTALWAMALVLGALTLAVAGGRMSTGLAASW